MTFYVPGKREPGVEPTPIQDADDATLTTWINRITRKLEEDPTNQYAERDREWVAAAVAELESRGEPVDTPPADAQQSSGQQAPPRQAPPRQSPPPAAQRQRQAPAQGIQVVGESISNGTALLAALQRLSETCTLVATTTATDSLPEGCAVAISMVRIDPTVDGYPLTGSRESPKPTDRIGLTKTAIERIGAAAGASWIPGLTGRVDDARDPHYCHYQAWVRFQDIDGSFRDYPGECEIDLRDGSPQVQDIIRKAEAANKKVKPGEEWKIRDPQNQLAEARKFIQRQCASKAMLVALRRPGLRHWYTREELQRKPFAVTKLIFHGRTQDPELKKVFAKIIAERFSGAARQLFGEAPRLVKHAAPPVGTVPIDVPGETVSADF